MGPFIEVFFCFFFCSAKVNLGSMAVQNIYIDEEMRS